MKNYYVIDGTEFQTAQDVIDHLNDRDYTEAELKVVEITEVNFDNIGIITEWGTLSVYDWLAQLN